MHHPPRRHENSNPESQNARNLTIRCIGPSALSACTRGHVSQTEPWGAYNLVTYSAGLFVHAASTTIKHCHSSLKEKKCEIAVTFAGLTFALALAFSLTTAAQTSSTESKQPASPDQRQADSAGNMHRDRVGERLKWLSQQLNLTEDQKELKPILAGEFKHNESGGRRRITDSRPKARKDEANP